MSERCAVCRDLGLVAVGFDSRAVSPCVEPGCVERRMREAAVAILSHEHLAAIFKGGDLKLSMGIKGYELTDEETTALADFIQGTGEFKKLTVT